MRPGRWPAHPHTLHSVGCPPALHALFTLSPQAGPLGTGFIKPHLMSLTGDHWAPLEASTKKQFVTHGWPQG